MKHILQNLNKDLQKKYAIYFKGFLLFYARRITMNKPLDPFREEVHFPVSQLMLHIR